MDASYNPFKQAVTPHDKKEDGIEMREMKHVEKPSVSYPFNRDIALMLADFASAVYAPFEKFQKDAPIQKIKNQKAWDALNKTALGHEKGLIFKKQTEDFWIFDLFGISEDVSKISYMGLGNPGYFGFIALKLSDFDKQVGITLDKAISYKDYDGMQSQLKAEWIQKRTKGTNDTSQDKALETIWEKEIWNDKITSKIREIVIVFRGTQTREDWVTKNADFAKVKLFGQPLFESNSSFDKEDLDSEIHGGFSDIYNLCGKYICDRVSSLLLSNKPAYEPRIYVTGHSLGGALATLCALHLNLKLGIEPIVYTFASPSVGNQHFANFFNKKIAVKYNYAIQSYASIRFLHNLDKVTTIIGSIAPNAPGNKSVHVDTAVILGKDSDKHAIISYREDVKALYNQIATAEAEREKLVRSQALSNTFSQLRNRTNYALSGETVLLNGMKLIFDQPVGVYPVNLQSKDGARRNGN